MAKHDGDPTQEEIDNALKLYARTKLQQKKTQVRTRFRQVRNEMLAQRSLECGCGKPVTDEIVELEISRRQK